MSGLKIIIMIGIVVFFPPAISVAQQKSTKFGPVVSAYLTGLGEELRELEYQIRRDEISRADYQRAKQRLTLLRRLVEGVAAGNRPGSLPGNLEDVVPEFQILADDELKALGPSLDLDPDQLLVGAEFDNQWRLFGIERGSRANRLRFFIFERLRRKEGLPRGEVVSERKRNRQVDLLAVETIIVNERPPETAAPQPQPVLGTSRTISSELESQQNRVQLPRILHIYPPDYTVKAREQKIEGDLVVRALFQRDGKVKNIKIEKGLGFGLDQRATAAVKRIGFLPAQVDGQDRDSQAEIIFNFTLESVSVTVRATNEGVMEKGAKQ